MLETYRYTVSVSLLVYTISFIAKFRLQSLGYLLACPIAALIRSLQPTSRDPQEVVRLEVIELVEEDVEPVTHR
jgi:hypothetical protein